MYSPSLLRVALIFISSYSFYQSVTPPGRPAQSQERVTYARKKRGLFDIAFFPVRSLLSVVQGFVHGMNAFELLHSAQELRFLTKHDTSFAHFPNQDQPSSLSLSFFLGVVFMAAGTYLRTTCYRTLGRHFTLELSLQEDHELVTHGPYAVVRHPSYTGAIVLYVGVVLSQLGPSSCWTQTGMWGSNGGKTFGLMYALLIAFTVSVILKRIPKEDAVMRAEFKEKWAAWAQRTPYRLVPFVY